MDHVTLLLHLQHGDEGALAGLYEHFAGRVFALVIKMLGSKEEAEEVLQDTFVKLHHNAHRYRADLGSPQAFIYTIARNEALSRLRARAARPSKADGWDMHDPSVPFSDTPKGDPLERIMIGHALGKLKDDDRELLELSFYGGYSHAELSEHTGMPLGTVKSRLRRSLLQLRDDLEEA